jgi:hypothetical protein
MRIRAALIILALSAPAIAAEAPAIQTRPGVSPPAVNCPHTTSYLADRSGLYRGKPLTPRKLTQLPSGTAYMAVFRRIGGCEAPLTMVDYRNPRRR